MALAWWLVPCLPFPDLPHIYFLFTVRLTNERVGVFLARRSVQHLVVFPPHHGGLEHVYTNQSRVDRLRCLRLSAIQYGVSTTTWWTGICLCSSVKSSSIQAFKIVCNLILFFHHAIANWEDFHIFPIDSNVNICSTSMAILNLRTIQKQVTQRPIIQSFTVCGLKEDFVQICPYSSVQQYFIAIIN